MNALSPLKKIIATFSVLASLLAPLSPLTFIANAQPVQPNVAGYAWAGQKQVNADGTTDTLGVGYIKMSEGTTYGVTIPRGAVNTALPITGTAWSPNIGWISFNPEARGDKPEEQQTSCPPRNNCSPTVTWAADGSAVIKGWARACAVLSGNCNGTFRADEDLGSWDGWIALSNPDGGNWPGSNNGQPVTGWKIEKKVVGQSTQKMSGFAWGSDVVGWVDFSNVTIIDPGLFCTNLLPTEVALVPTPENAVRTNVSGVPGQSATDTYCDFCPGAEDPGVQDSTAECDGNNSCTVTQIDGDYCPTGSPTTTTISWATDGSVCTVNGVANNGTSKVVSINGSYVVKCFKDTAKTIACKDTITISPKANSSICEDPDTCADGSLQSSHPNNICPENKCKIPVAGVCTCPGYTPDSVDATGNALSCKKKAPIIIEF